MDNKVVDILLLSEYETPEGLRYMVWKVAGKEFLELRDEYVEVHDCELQEASRWALDKFIVDNKAEYLGSTEQDAQLFAANLREAGLKARCIK